MIMSTNSTKRMNKKRISEEVQNFKEKVLDFFDKANVSPEIRYKICVDLAKKMDMPFYKEKKIGTQSRISCVDRAKEYVRLLIEYDDFSFSEKLINELTKQQQQTLRKIHPRTKEQKTRKEILGKDSVWEHPIPTNYSKQLILSYIRNKNQDSALKFIDYLSKVPQIALSKDEDKTVNEKFKDSMPEGWHWEEIGKNDQFARYKAAKIRRFL